MFDPCNYEVPQSTFSNSASWKPRKADISVWVWRMGKNYASIWSQSVKRCFILFSFFVLFNQLIGWGSPISGRAICFWLLIQLLIVNAEIPSQTHPEQHLIKSLSTQVVAQRSWHIKLPSQRHSVTTYLPWTSRLQTSFTWMENKSLLFLIYIFRSLIARCNF